MKERIIKFIESQGVSVRKFCVDIGISHNLLSNNSSLGSDKLVKIWNSHRELNMDWVITGRGEMIYKEPVIQYGTPEINTYAVEANGDGYLVAVDVLKERVTTLQEKLISCMEERDSLLKK